MWVDLDQVCAAVWPRPDLRSRSRSFRSCEYCTFLRLLLHHFGVELKIEGWWWQYGTRTTAYQSPIFEFPPRKAITSSNFTDCRYFTKFKWPYFGSAWCYSHLLGHGGSPTRTVYVDTILTRPKVKVKVTDHLNFRQLPITAHFQVCLPCHFAWSLKLMVTLIVWDLVYSLSEPDFRTSF